MTVDPTGSVTQGESTAGSSAAPDSEQSPGRFGRILALSGRGFVPLGLFARLPLAMLNVGVLTLVTAVSHSYAIGGFAAGAAGIGSAMGAPLLGFIADRIGQKPVLIAAAVANTVFLGLVIALSYWIAGAEEGFNGANIAWILVASWLAGASSPQVGPLARVRWMALVRKVPESRRDGALDTALSYESTADELTFVLGPALVGILASLIAPWLPIVLAAALTLSLVTAFALHRTVHAVAAQRGGKIAPEPVAGNDRSVWLKVAVPVLGMLCMGTFFGSTLTSLSAFTGSVAANSGGSELAGLLYAVMGLSSAAAALSVAYWPRSFGQRWRWLVLAAAMAILSVFLLLPDTVPTMLLALFLLGIPVGPTMVTIFSIGGLVAPRRWLGTVMTLLASGIVAGTALGSSLAGSLAEGSGYHQAFIVPVAAASLLFLLGLLTAAWLRGASVHSTT
ncbi:MFS transporter [Psychromicrobium lacuslunae]|uniref:MFS transporter n=1 Tax=Psychromicrobium lacuslunae TaxID=1618207 RepID=A0A0D4C318_9MICC|nr:MFS transporter [Psychromicrobium lacuslunae]